ncbi:DUF4435 domain-containing protein [Flavobacterium sp. NKUCC04_CG]|uniref:DUF4435 domain-containing protein n=1 Tax=Flavobacterium sp. NKUCC04_CG TaxID=2842121 RepID=UPI001C5A72FB|nr:DUF4435 domain-containing protein [Flavobacterium sp. NKUCC04_CG]MBW3520415.1 DUF4435 domain-containing protein [Flavobacterium sp. NKUCC04_CG]
MDLVYDGFNKIDFFIEDTNKERYYFNIFKNLFPDIQLNKIFPLNGKDKVIEQCRLSKNNKKKIYIIDKDFDDLLNKKEQYDNLFYLNRYSIENLLISKKALYEIIIEDYPKLDEENINNKFNYDDLLSNLICLNKLSRFFIMINDKKLGVTYRSLNSNKDLSLLKTFSYKSDIIFSFYKEVKSKFIEKYPTDNFFISLNEYSIYFTTKDDCLTHIPGKYLLEVIQTFLKQQKLINQCTYDSFCYRLTKNIDESNFSELKNSITFFSEIDTIS